MGGGAAFLGGLINGVTGAVNEKLNQKAADKRQLSMEEIEGKAGELNGRLAGVQAQLAKDPTNKDLHGQLNQILADRTALYHPSNGPGAMAALGKLFHAAVHGPTPTPATSTATPQISLPQRGPSYNQDAIPGTPETSSVPGKPGVSAEPGVSSFGGSGMQGAPLTLPPSQGVVVHPATTPAELKTLADQRFNQDMTFGFEDPRKTAADEGQFQREQKGLDRDALVDWGQKHNISDEAMQELTTNLLGIKTTTPKLTTDKPWKGTDGKWYRNIENPDGSISADPLPPNYQPPAPNNVPKIGSFGDFVLATFGEHPTAQDYVKARRLWTPISNTTGTHVVMVPQVDGSIKPVTVETTSTRGPAGGSGSLPSTRQDAASTGAPATATPPGSSKPSPAAPTGNSPTAATPGGLKAKAKSAVQRGGRTAAGVVNVGDAVGGRLTPGQTKADEAVNAAAGLVSLADDALSAPSSAKDHNLALAIIRGAAGRVNMQEYNLLAEHYGGKAKFEQWANNISSGEFPPEVRKQLVDLAHSSYKSAQAMQSQSRQSPGTSAPGSDPSIDDIVNALNKGK